VALLERPFAAMSLSNYNDIVVKVADGIGTIKVCSNIKSVEDADI